MLYLSGKDLAAQRRRKGMTQAELATAAGIGRHAVGYWEGKRQVDGSAWAVKRMAAVLGPLLPDLGLTKQDRIAQLTGGVSVDFPVIYRVRIMTPRRPACAAKTRKGTPCTWKAEPGKARCKLHGGRSTGAKTEEGRERIAEAQRRRWARWRAERSE
ncbi:HGGxSTG domain-containing protein [Pararhodobacter aggregans]